MRLTKHIREAFVRAAMDDVPQIDYQQQANELATKAMAEKMPPEVKKLAANEKTRAWLNTGFVSLPGLFSSLHTVRPEDGYGFIEQNCPAVWGKMVKLYELHHAQREKLAALRIKLESCAESVTTRKALAELLPEFEKYLPADNEAAIKTLPAVANVVADFAAAGWPKGKKPARKAA